MTVELKLGSIDITEALPVELIDETLTVELGPAIVISGGGNYNYYDDAYDIAPLRTAQVLETEGLVMRKDVNVRGVTFQQTTNASGGKTCNIGGADN